MRRANETYNSGSPQDTSAANTPPPRGAHYAVAGVPPCLLVAALGAPYTHWPVLCRGGHEVYVCVCVCVCVCVSVEIMTKIATVAF
jgi:hypothetical protein